MMMTTMTEFLPLIGEPTQNQINLTKYYRHTFRCACGLHVFDQITTLLCEGYWRLILVCPDDNRFVTNVRARMILIQEFGGLATGYGTRIDSSADQAMLDAYMVEVTDR